MKSKHFLQLIIFSLFVFCSSMAFALSVPADKAQIWSEQKGRELIDTLAEDNLELKYDRLDELFLNNVDLDYVARFVIGKYWRDMNDEQKERYVSLFKRYSLALYKGYPLNFDKEDVDFSIEKVSVEDTYTLVLANIHLKSFVKRNDNRPEDSLDILVEFRLHEKDDKVLLMDLKIAETSFLLTYRSRFYEMVKNNDDDIEWFLEDLEMSTASAETNNELKLDM